MFFLLVRPEAPTLVTHLFIPSQARESVASAKLEADVVIIVIIDSTESSHKMATIVFSHVLLAAEAY